MTASPPSLPVIVLRRYLRFVAESPRFLGFGFLLAFFSSFGQTFFIGLFNTDIRSGFSLSHGDFGALYSAATLVSAMCLTWLGRLIDVVELRVYSLAVAALLVGACFLLAAAGSVAILALAILGLRLGGQGLMSHIAVTSMARYFERDRGKAVAVAVMGHPAGEATLPLMAVALSALLGWRGAWIAIGAALTVLLPPVIISLLRGHAERHRRHLERAEATRTLAGAQWSRRQVVRDPRFYLILPTVLASSFIMTGLFFHEAHLAETKGWSLAWFATCFVGYAGSTVAASLLAGPLIDRFGARRLLPFYLMPLVLALALLSALDHPAVAMAFMLCAGVSTGANFIVTGAVWAELYGTAHLGAIRAMAQALMVLSTAVSPVLLGWLLDAEVGIEAIALGCLAYILLGAALASMAVSIAPRRHAS